MKWFDRWLVRKWRWAYDNRDEIELVTTSSSAKLNRVIPDDESWEDGLRITIKKMIGGSVVSFAPMIGAQIDRKADTTSSLTTRISTPNWARS